MQNKQKSSVLIIYTGGTIGMKKDAHGVLKPFKHENITNEIPILKTLDTDLQVISFNKPIDSSNMTIQDWQYLATCISDNYDNFDAFVILHGTDTMAYTASALSWMLQNLSKPVILTGAQLPIGFIRSDARDNIINSLEIAIAKKDGKPIIQEVCIYFNHKLLKGNRAKKTRSDDFSAFDSPHFPALAKVGIFIDFKFNILKPLMTPKKLEIKLDFNPNVAILSLFPNITLDFIEAFFSIKNLQGVILETFGSGNIMNNHEIIKILKKKIESGMIIGNISQCYQGVVLQGRYENSNILNEIGVFNGKDMTSEAAVTKLMFLLGQNYTQSQIKTFFENPLDNEMS